jgi:Fe-S cluster biogenesis protein NfuA
VILLALIKEDVVESDAVEVEVREVFEMPEVTLVAGACTSCPSCILALGRRLWSTRSVLPALARVGNYDLCRSLALRRA